MVNEKIKCILKGMNVLISSYDSMMAQETLKRTVFIKEIPHGLEALMEDDKKDKIPLRTKFD